ncbi:MAG: flagellar basal body P-ring protein FlgI [Gammaproteobacteria bacterium]|nr:flagellar basal body P-ring protein FlgI [Gammaproteobacteria bacterium]
MIEQFRKLSIALSLLSLLALSSLSHAERIKDLTSVQGVRENPLLGYGLVVGLDGSGDQTGQVSFTEQSLRSMLLQFGVTVPPDTKIQPKNVAAVSIHAVLPPFVKPGQQLDITISSLGNAKSLRGGSLLMAPLKGADGQIYAVAQGNVIVGGAGASGADGSSVTVNTPSVGRIPNGAIVERAVPSNFESTERLVLNLHAPDFTTAKRVEEVINNAFNENQARAIDAVSIMVDLADIPLNRVEFLSTLQQLEVQPGDQSAKIIINARTGTIVIGNHVTVMPAAVSHGGLTVTIDEAVNVTQPNPLADGDTAVTPESEVTIDSGGPKSLYTFSRGITLQEVVQAMNEVGASTGDLVSILEALHQVGALTAELIVI